MIVDTDQPASNGRARSPKVKLVDDLPHDRDAELSVLGSVILDPALMDGIAEIVQPMDWHYSEARAVWREMLAMQRDGLPLDHMALSQRLKGCEAFEDSPIRYLTEAAQAGTIPSHAIGRAKIVHNLAQRRQAIRTAEAIAQQAIEGDIETTLDWAQHHLQRIASGGDNDSVKPIPLVQLLRDYPELRPPIVDGIGRRGETANIISNSKVGKSWFAYLLLWSIITGRSLFGRFQCTPGRVLLIDMELHRETLAYRINKVARAMHIDPNDYADMFDTLPLRGRLKDIHGIIRDIEGLAKNGYVGVILDSKYRAMPEGTSENDNADETRFYNAIDGISDKLNCLWFNVHHNSKGDQSGKAITDVGAGAGAQSRACDAHLIMRQHDEPGCFVFEGVVRSFAPIEPLVLRWEFPLWSAAEGLDPNAIKGRGTKQEERSKERDKQGINAIIDALRKLQPQTARKLRINAGLSKDRCDRLLASLLKDEQITANTITIRGNECEEYSLKDVVDDDRPREPTT